MDKVQFKTPNAMFLVTTEVATAKEIFEKVGYYAELFTDNECGLCHSTNIVPRKRKAGDSDEYDYYEMQCLNPECRARLSFGQSKDKVSLFPKRKGEGEGATWLPNNGWAKYIPKQGEKHDPPPPAQETTRRAPPGSAPPAPVDPPEVKQLIQRATLSQANREKVEQELCDSLRALQIDAEKGQALVLTSWAEAVDKAKDDDDILRRLYAIVQREKSK